MDNDFRKRWAVPLLVLAGVLVSMLAFAFSISRVLLAVPETVATFTALAVASYVLLVAAVVTKRRRITPRALGGGLAVGLVAVVAAGVVAAQAGMRELHPDEDSEAAGGEAPADGEALPDDAFVWVAVDIEYPEAPAEIPAGEVTIAIDNQGQLVHNVVFEEASDVIVEADGGQQNADTFTLEAGTYTYFCSVPGHREAGMEGTVEVTG